MLPEITTISLPLPFRLGSVNCYLVKTEGGYVLIDTGGSNKRDDLEKALDRAGCHPEDLKLIILTHGDFDHSGNAVYLRQRFDAQIGMHSEEAKVVERGDIFASRQKANKIIAKIAQLLFGFGKAHRFSADITVEDGYDLSIFGFSAKVLHIPGHSLGSIAILTAAGDLFCGDLLENPREPSIGSIIDDLAAARDSIERLSGFAIQTVYPGHGKSFPMETFEQYLTI